MSEKIRPLWKRLQQKNIRTIEELAQFLELTPEQCLKVHSHKRFPLNLPLRLAKNMQKGNLDDPLLLQFLPTLEEEKTIPGFSTDPLQEKSFQKTPKLLHKYNGRVLLLLTGTCAMHCRYCFRNHFDYVPLGQGLFRELEYIRQDSSIEEVILSGGDPLSLSEASLHTVLEQLDLIPHIRRIRFHSRFPIGIPERIHDEFLVLLRFWQSRFQFWFFLHINHPHELGDDLFEAIRGIQQLGIPVGTQTVLLRRVNDSVETLHILFTQLVNHGLLPYYLFQLDPVAGSSHFNVPIHKGLEIMEELQKLLPGYGVPKYVREIPHRPHKEMILKDSLPLHTIQ
ncbi:KamA family radical SAM protein [Candidatus Similichlamydia laticola]|nr:KamA family radical SAM protein [Candidatus Similichlamydia laticola]